MSIRCIALDLDQTTLNEHGRLSPGNRDALIHAIHKGIHIVIASGRSFSSLPEDVVSIPGIEYAITSNGAAVYHVPSGRCLHRYTMTALSVQKVLSLTATEPIAYEAFWNGNAYADAAYVQNPTAYGATPQAVPYIQRTRQPIADISTFIRSHQSQLDSMDLVVSDQAVKQRLHSILAEEVPDLYITSSVPELLELSHRNGGKHSGVRFIAKTLGLLPTQIAAFGDGDNDADLLTYVGCGIAMENATPACKAAANCITLPNSCDGVAYGIRTILGI